MTKFADMTLSEFEQRVLMRPPPLPEKRPHVLPNSINFNVLPTLNSPHERTLKQFKHCFSSACCRLRHLWLLTGATRGC